MNFDCLYIGSKTYHDKLNQLQDYLKIEFSDHRNLYPSDFEYDLYIIEYNDMILGSLDQIASAYIVIITEDMDGKHRQDFIKHMEKYKVNDVIFGQDDFYGFKMRLHCYVKNLVFKAFMDKMHMEAVITDDQSNIIYTNEAFTDETGYAFTRGMKPNVLKSGYHSMMFYNNLYHTIKSGLRWQGKIKNKRKDGTMFYEDAAIFPLQVFGHNYFGKVGYNTTKHDELVDETEKSLQMAKAIQRSLISEDVYDEQVIIRGKYRPLANVSGDIYNIYRIDDHTYSVLLADVAGHGVGSALLSTTIIAISNELVRSEYMPDVFLKRLNERVMDLLSNQDLSVITYFTAAYVVIDTKEKQMHYANCGHPQIYHIKDQAINGIFEINFTVGMFSDVEFAYNTCKYQAGDCFLIYTDGLVEMGQNITEGQMLLEEQLNTYRQLDNKPSLVEYLDQYVNNHIGGVANDDITIIGIDLK